MSRTHLRRLAVRGYKSFRDESVLDFPERGLTLLQCLNRDTGGSSGGGKSNLFETVAAALGFADAPATETQCWQTEEPQRVTLSLLGGDGAPWEVSWGAKPALRTADLDKKLGRPISGAAAIAEQRRRLIGLPEETVGALTYRPQGTGGKILSLPNAQLQKFLSDLLPLGAFEDALGAGAAEREKLERQVAAAEALEARAEGALRALQSGPPVPEQTDTSLLEERARAAVGAATAAASALTEARKELDDFDSDSPGVYSVTQFGNSLAVADAMNALQVALARPLPEVPTDPEISRLENGIEMARQLFATAVAAENAAHEAARAKDKALREQIEAALRTAGVGAQAAFDAKRAREQIFTLKAQKCYTCDRPWVSPEQVDALAKAEAELSEAEGKVERGLTASVEAANLKKEQATITWDRNPEVAQWNEEVERLRGIVAERRAAMATERVKVRAARDAEVLGLRAMVAEEEAKRDRAIAEVSAKRSAERRPHEAAVAARQTEHEAASKATAEEQAALEAARRGNVARSERLRALGAAEREFEATRANAACLRAALAAERDFAACFGREGFMGAIFDEILAEIADEANATMAVIPNIATVSLAFRSEARTEKGAIVRGIKPVISVGGHQAVLRSGASGGMRSAIHLAADAAVRRVIARRTGAMPMWWFLDESFDGLELTCKEACMELLAVAAQDALVVVVDHDERFKSMFAQAIKLERAGGATRVVGVGSV